MRILFGVWLAVVMSASGAQSGKPRKGGEANTKQGIKTPGVQVPFSNLKADAELPLAPRWIVFSDSVLIPNKTGGLERLEAKTNKLIDPIAGTYQFCGGAATGFTSLWIPDCDAHALIRLDAKIAADPKAAPRGGRGGRAAAPDSEKSAPEKESKPAEKPADKIADAKPAEGRQGGGRGGRGGGPAKLAEPVKIDSGVGTAVPAVAANPDSVWILSDDRTTLSRVDPDQNKVVSELRLPEGCNSLTFGETALWVTCPAENKVLRINPETTLVEKRIDVSAQPTAVAIGESSLWVLCLKDGKIERIDPKTNKITKTIETGIAGSAMGGIAIGGGSVWVTLPGFPLTRIDPASEKVVQQFWGKGGGAIQFGQGSVWLTNLQEGTLWRIDPKRVLATLSE